MSDACGNVSDIRTKCVIKSKSWLFCRHIVNVCNLLLQRLIYLLVLLLYHLFSSQYNFSLADMNT